MAVVLTVLGFVGALNAAVAVAADTTPPTAPRHISGGSTEAQVTLFWGRASDDVGVALYHVERCNGAGCRDFGEIGTSTSTAFVDSGLANGATYRYRVRASDTAGNLGPYSKIVAVTVGEASPAPGAGGGSRGPRAPRSLTATASGTAITLHWTAARDNVAVVAYVVQRCQGAGCVNFARLTQVGAVTSYTDSGLPATTRFQYRVRGLDAAGNLGQFSPVASAQTQGGGGGGGGNPPPTGLLSPRAVALTFTQTQQFTTDLGSPTWSVDGIEGGSNTVGTITADGVYSPPSAVGKHTVLAANGAQSEAATVYVSNYAGKFTLHNDNARTGQNLSETVLTPANVSPATFGKLFSYSIDGISYASPLYVANLPIPGLGFRNVVYVATQNNSVYAFDADGRQGDPIWQVNFNGPGVGPVPAGDTGECCDIAPVIGITGTPVIDPVSRTIYVVVKTKEGADYAQRLHALDITTGDEKFGGPVLIQGSVPGTGPDAQGGMISFDPLRENQRPGLLLSNGVLYIGWGSHGDNGFYHGWIIGYNASTLKRTMTFNSTPNTYKGGIWQGGGGLAADAAGNLFFVTGNGPFTANQGGVDYGDSFVKLSSNGKVADYFTPHDAAALNDADIDLGAASPLLLPDQGNGGPPLMMEAGKDGKIYLVDRDDMGKFHANSNGNLQTFSLPFATQNLSSPVYYKGSIYIANCTAPISQYRLDNSGVFAIGAQSQSAASYNYPGAAMAISAQGNNNGLLWAIQTACTGEFAESCIGVTDPGILRAYDASDLTKVRYSSDQSGGRDTLDTAAKFSTPLVANGKVFVASENQLTAYGFLP